MTSFRPAGDKEWSYMRLHRPVADHTLMDEIAPGVIECVAGALDDEAGIAAARLSQAAIE